MNFLFRGHQLSIEIRWITLAIFAGGLQLLGATFLTLVFAFTLFFIACAPRVFGVLTQLFGPTNKPKVSVLCSWRGFESQGSPIVGKLRVRRQLSASTVLEEKLLEEEFKKLEAFIIRDFVEIWTYEISPQSEQLQKWVEGAVRKVRGDLVSRIMSIQVVQLVDIVLQLYAAHISTFRAIFMQQGRSYSQSNVSQLYSLFEPLHSGAKDENSAKTHFKTLLRIIFSHAAVGNQELTTFISTGPGLQLLLSILSENCLLLLDYLTDPDTIFQIIVLIISAVISQDNTEITDLSIKPITTGENRELYEGQESVTSELSVTSIFPSETEDRSIEDDFTEGFDFIPDAEGKNAGAGYWSESNISGNELALRTRSPSYKRNPFGKVAGKFSNRGMMKQFSLDQRSFSRINSESQSTSSDISRNKRGLLFRKINSVRKTSSDVSHLMRPMHHLRGINDTDDVFSDPESSPLSPNPMDFCQVDEEVMSTRTTDVSSTAGDDLVSNLDFDLSDVDSDCQDGSSVTSAGSNKNPESLTNPSQTGSYCLLSGPTSLKISIPCSKIYFNNHEFLPRRKQIVLYEVRVEFLETNQSNCGKQSVTSLPETSSNERGYIGSQLEQRSPRLPHIAYKRFRDFLHLHNRLSRNRQVVHFLRKVPSPYYLIRPYTPYDHKILEERRVVLERYVQQLVTSQATCQSKEFLTFLEIDNDPVYEDSDTESCRGSGSDASSRKTSLFSIGNASKSDAASTYESNLMRKRKRTPESGVFGKFWDTAKDYSSLVLPRPRPRILGPINAQSFAQTMFGVTYSFNVHVLHELQKMDVNLICKSRLDTTDVASSALHNYITNHNSTANLLQRLTSFESEVSRKQLVDSVDPINVSVLNLGQILCHFFPYNISKFQFLQDIIFLFMGTRIRNSLDSVRTSLFSAGNTRKVVKFITGFLWPNSKLLEVDTEERKAEDKVKTEKEATKLVTHVLLKSLSHLSEDHAIKIADDVVSAFKDKTINRHLFFCVLDALFKIAYQH